MPVSVVVLIPHPIPPPPSTPYLINISPSTTLGKLLSKPPQTSSSSVWIYSLENSAEPLFWIWSCLRQIPLCLAASTTTQTSISAKSKTNESPVRPSPDKSPCGVATRNHSLLPLQCSLHHTALSYSFAASIVLSVKAIIYSWIK